VLGTSRRPVSWANASPQPDGPFEVLHAREIVEASVASEAAKVARPEHIAAIDQVLSRMDECGGSNDNWIKLDREFHVAIAASLDNGVLVRFVGQLFDQRINPYFEHLASYFEDASTWRQALAEHRAILDAIAAGDPKAARLAMKRHLKLSQERFSRGFGEPVTPLSATGLTMPAALSGPAGPHPLHTKSTRRKPQ
jgi:DNA-binding FadR family transcriptional regulator